MTGEPTGSAEHPILYSFRRCPYAMRARMALLVSEQVCVLREVALRAKPTEMLAVSAKATVPVLVPAGRRRDRGEPRYHALGTRPKRSRRLAGWR